VAELDDVASASGLRVAALLAFFVLCHPANVPVSPQG
jgi:hypothetical protein